MNSVDAVVVRLRGLPTKTSKEDVLAFLEGFTLTAEQVHLQFKERRSAGEVSAMCDVSTNNQTMLRPMATHRKGAKRRCCAFWQHATPVLASPDTMHTRDTYGSKSKRGKPAPQPC